MIQFILDNKPFAQTDREDLIQHYLDLGCVEVPILYNGSFLKPLWNGSEWIEGATPEEIAEQQQAEALEQAKQFLANNKTAGEDYYNNINLRVTVALFAVEKNVLFPILQEIEAILYPPLNKIKTGDFASALFIFSNQTPPTDAFVLSFYNEALDFCQNYYDTNYPK